MYKSGSSKQKYRVLDIEKAVSNYENGTDTSIGQSNYSFFKNEIERVKEVLRF